MNQTIKRPEATKSDIIQSFSSAAEGYEAAAEVQRECAKRLARSIEPWREMIPPGPLLELGCGTGYLSRKLVDLFPDRPLTITDISSTMLERCKQSVKPAGAEQCRFEVMDADNLPETEQQWAMITHNFVAQWFQDPAFVMEQHLAACKPGGLMVAAFPGNESFPEWKKVCKQADIPYTGNELPNVEELGVKLSLGPCQIDFYEDTITQKFDSAIDFFRSIKGVGAATNRSEKKLSAAQFRRLISHWEEGRDRPITVSWHIIFLAVKKDYVAP